MSGVLLTGSSGFIGSRVKSLLIERGYNVRALSYRALEAYSPVESIVGDIRDISICRRAVRGVDVVIHLAGEKRNSADFWPVNVQGTRNLLTAALDEGIGHFVHMSTVGVIGANPFQPEVFDEEAFCMPKNDYERSKWEAEKLVRQARAAELPVDILRPSNVFGDRDPQRCLLTLLHKVKQGLFVYLGGRDVLCNYVFVDDVAHAILTLAEHPNEGGRTYNLSDQCTLGEFVDSLAADLRVKRPCLALPNSVAHLIRLALGAAKSLSWLSTSSLFSRLVSLNNQASFATSTLRDDLGFQLPVGWRAGLRRTIEWYRSQGLL